MNKHIDLGERVRDVVTGLTGIAVSRCEYLNGCVHYGIAPKADKDAKLPDTVYLDWQRLEVVKGGIVGRFATSVTGGPQHDAPRR